MFIKKDLRKIDQILSDDSDELNSLKLSKRCSGFLVIPVLFYVALLNLTGMCLYCAPKSRSIDC